MSCGRLHPTTTMLRWWPLSRQPLLLLLPVLLLVAFAHVVAPARAQSCTAHLAPARIFSPQAWNGAVGPWDADDPDVYVVSLSSNMMWHNFVHKPITGVANTGGYSSDIMVSKDGSKQLIVRWGNPHGDLWMSTNKGDSWSLIRSASNADRFDASDDFQTILLPSVNRPLEVSQDSGANWALGPSGSWIDVAVQGDGAVMIAITQTGFTTLAKSIDGGSSWTTNQFGNPTLNYAAKSLVCSRDDCLSNMMFNNFGAQGANTGVWRSTDGGATWTQTISMPTVDNSQRLTCDYACQIVVVSYANGNTKLPVSHDGGLTWTQVEYLTGNDLNGQLFNNIEVQQNNGMNMWAFSSSNMVARSYDGGLTWTALKDTVVTGVDVSGCQSSSLVPIEDCKLSCVGTGTVTPSCVNGGAFTHVSDCAPGTCSAPAPTPGYDTSQCVGGTGLDDCVVTCDAAQLYIGTAVAACAKNGGVPFTLSGCVPCTPDPTIECGTDNCNNVLPACAGDLLCHPGTQKCVATESARIQLGGPSPSIVLSDGADAVLQLPSGLALTPGSAETLATVTCDEDARGRLYVEKRSTGDGDVLRVCAWNGSAFEWRTVSMGSAP